MELNCIIAVTGEINSGIHMCQVTFEPLHWLLFSNVVVVSDFNKNFGGTTDLAKIWYGWWICISLFTPLLGVRTCNTHQLRNRENKEVNIIDLNPKNSYKTKKNGIGLIYTEVNPEDFTEENIQTQTYCEGRTGGPLVRFTNRKNR